MVQKGMKGRDDEERNERQGWLRKEWKAGMTKKGMESRDDEERNGRQG